jgi:pimeloyl-ACP methyl ester carboxylesterase
VRATNGGPAVAPGTGPAREFAREGFAGASWDGPHGGLRNVTRGDEQFLMFNVTNLGALRDNVRQSALEAAELAHLLGDLRIDASACPGLTAPGNVARLDARVMALMGHSMGASIAPLAVSYEPAYRALLLSGAGGSWIANVLYKQRPLAVRPFAEALLRYNGTGSTLAEDDPSLSLLQWALEAADVPVFAARVTASPPRHVLMMQGIVDHYIMPPIANAASLSLGLDLAGASRDAADARLAAFDPLARWLPLRGLAVREGAVAGNRAMFTQVVRQYPEDGIEDGHEDFDISGGTKETFWFVKRICIHPTRQNLT